MADPRLEEITEAIYLAALDPAAWDDVMRLMGEAFDSTLRTFYFLHLAPRRLHPVSAAGLDERWIASFDALHFAPDNPWIRLTRRLHRPGIVRTNERLDAWTGERSALYRSAYYNEWMRPQGFKYTIGNTMYAADGLVANVTLMRPPDLPTYDDGDIALFTDLSGHMTRSLRMAMRLESAAGGYTATRSFDGLPQAIAMVDGRGRLAYANPAMEALLRRASGLAARNGALHAGQAQPQLAAFLAASVAAARGGPASGSMPLALRHAGGCLRVDAVPSGGAFARYAGAAPMLLLTITEEAGDTSPTPEALRARYSLTGAEARLAALLARGVSLREAAADMGVTYGTARAYLKVAFEKTGVHSQAQLVGRLLGDAREATGRG